MSFGLGVIVGFLLSFCAMCGLVFVAGRQVSGLLDKLEILLPPECRPEERTG